MRTLSVLALLVAACDPYDPALGEAPFLCGPPDNPCPEGYHTETRLAGNPPTNTCVCVTGITTIDAGSGDYACNSDTHEPNETATAATTTAIGITNTTSFNGVAICPATDFDYYKMDLDNGQQLTVTVTFDSTRTAPTLEIVDAAGGIHAVGAASGADKVVAIWPCDVSGYAYAKVSGSVEVNYTIRMETT
jgi:hypothetical protein